MRLDIWFITWSLHSISKDPRRGIEVVHLCLQWASLREFAKRQMFELVSHTGAFQVAQW